jgi:hypothetical protein
VSRPRLEVADVVRRYGDAYRLEHLDSMSITQYRVLRDIEWCRTAALGGHVEQCDSCSHQRISFNSCRNRHCPKCQSLARAVWLERRQAKLLPCQYFHVVFTLPEAIATIAFHNPVALYHLLFTTAALTLRTIGADPKHLGAEIGCLAVLHTWGQTLTYHPHLHCVVPGGGLSPDGQRWVGCRPGFFLPVRVLSRLFRRLFVQRLERLYEAGELKLDGVLEPLREDNTFKRYIAPLRKQDWVVYAKAPFAGPQQVLDYLGRYTHRVAISNHRLLDINNGTVTFQWRDYRDDNRSKTMTLAADEFIRRFLLHVLPLGLQRIRYYGLMGNCHRKDKLAQCRALLGMAAEAPSEPDVQGDYRDRYEALTGVSLHVCPVCQHGHMLVVEKLKPFATGPPTPNRL